MNTDLEDKTSECSSSFSEFARTCEVIGSTRSKLSKVGLLSRYLTELTDFDLQIASTFLSGRIFPPGAEHTEVNVGYSLIWKTVSSLLEIDAIEFSKFYLRHGDLGSSIAEILQSKQGTSSLSREGILLNAPLTLRGVYSAFQELASSVGSKSQVRKKRILTRLLVSIKEPMEAKFLIRILTGEMRIGLVEGLLEEAVAKCFSMSLDEIRSANLVMGNIGLVALLTKNNRLKEATLEPFRPTNFMLAESAENAEDLVSKFSKMPVLSEFKYDGIRAQVHSSKGFIRLFSRNLQDVTRFFPEIEEEAKMIAKSFILDGEIVAFDRGGPLPFQLLQRRLRKLERSTFDVPIKYFAFDLLYFEGESLIQLGLEERCRILHTLNLRGNLAYSTQRMTSTTEEIVDMFNESKSLGYEGLVVKDPSSAYTPGRRGKNWIKLKKELDTLDVVIVSAEYGHGKRAGVLSDYTFAVRKGDELKVIGKAYSGLTDKEILEMTETLKQITLHDHGYRRSVKPQIVLEVAFDAIQKSQRHDSGYALRFPRIERIRRDKSVQDIDTLEKVEKIHLSQKLKI